MKVEIALDPSQMQSLSARVAPAPARGGAARAPAQPRRGGGRPRQPRPQKKTAEELDAEMAVGRVASSLADNSGLQGHQCGGVGADWSDFWYMSGGYELRRGHDASAMCLLPRRTSSLNPQHLTTGSALPIHMRHPALLKITELSASIILPFSSALCRVPLQLSTIAIPSLCCIPFARRLPSRESPFPLMIHCRRYFPTHELLTPASYQALLSDKGFAPVFSLAC